MAPTIAPDAKIPCTTPQQLRDELDTITWALEPEEKEDTWEKFERAIIRFAAVTRGGGYKMTDMFVEGVGRNGIGAKLAKCMLSDRGRLSGVSTDFLQTMAPRLSLNFKPLVHLYLEPLVQLLGRPNKVFLKRAEKCLLTIITHCQIPTILLELRRGLDDNAATCRKGCSIGLERTIIEWPKEIWSEKGLTVLEESVRKMATDKDPEVRQTGKRVWALFMDIWPERVEGFSAPLTPTVRRYLGVPAVGEAPKAKAKASSRPVAPPLRPISATSTESSLASSSNQPSHAAPHPDVRPQHHRVNALASRPVRVAAPLLLAPAPVEAGPSRRRSPRKDLEPLPRANEYEPEERSAPPVFARSATTNGDFRRDAPALGALGHHSRSVSHNTLPSSSSHSALHDEYQRYNPLSKPARPLLATSYSVPAESTEPAHPSRRFAPPARPVRIPTEEHMTAGQGDSIFKGPARNPHFPERRPGPLGQAHRRVVTAPVPSAVEAFSLGKALGHARNPSYRRHEEDHIHNQEEDHQTPQKGEGAHERATESEKAPVPGIFASPLPTHVVSMDSPLMPTLMRSTSGDVRVEEEDQNDIIDLQEEVYPGSPSIGADKTQVDIAAKVQLPESPTQANVDLPEVATCADDSMKEETKTDEQGAPQQEAAVHEESASSEKISDNVERRKLAPEAADVETQPSVASSEDQGPEQDSDSPAEVTHNENSNSVPAQSIPSKHASEPVKGASSSTKSRPPPTAKEATNAGPSKPKVLSTNAPPRKPPVPSARAAGPRTVSASISRRPFKPTSLTAPTAASAARAASISKPAPAPAVVSKPSVATSTTANPSAPSDVTAKVHTGPSKPPIPTAGGRARVVSAQIAPKPEKLEPKPTIKPSIPPNVRPAPTRVVSGPKKPAVTSHIVLPPVKKERVMRKAPLPSFRPTKSNAATTDNGAASLKASTASSTGGRAKVKPEMMIKLPDSPAKLAAPDVPLPPSRHEVPLPHSPFSKVTSAVSSAAKHKPSPLKIEVVRPRVRADSNVSHPNSPIALTRPKPLSPLLATVGPTDVENDELPKAPVFSMPAQSPASPRTESPAAKLPMADPFISASVPASPSFKRAAETATVEADMTSEIESDDDDLARITFKGHPRIRTASPALSINSIDTVPASPLKPSRTATALHHQANHINAFAPRTDVSTPQKSAAMLLAKLEGSEKGMNIAMSYTPHAPQSERKALSVKDANTPGLNGGGGESEWDVSA
ncbi:hypothetical protein I316_07695 [Kwoniella heveanensis BCC8398]|uniref:CLASP N-terminal domain-containing protein n=1 Tax=Kwoniella heveanensis BCC8398 TaxID=1296120 RepID=A0A1B9GI42_9TREE|nr:hypothetical protein I316_07695 [Kwoniella heveanensis BCC8398]